MLLHCSGAIPSGEAFAEVEGKVGGVGTLHPLRAISAGSVNEIAAGLRGTVFGVEGDATAQLVAKRLVAAMGGAALPLERQQMAAYHAAAAMASNYVVALVDAAAQALAASGMPMDQAVSALVPLAQGALANLAEHGAQRGLTGPIRRGDAQTVQRHLAALAVRPETQALYRALGRATVELAASIEGPEAPAAEALAQIRSSLE